MFQMLNSRELLKKALNIFYLLRPEDSNSVFGNFVSCTAWFHHQNCYWGYFVTCIITLKHEQLGPTVL